ncbi:MAG TPA: D-alanyl-D-alanine carboxypeptidase [Firmicutes bacterium]|nr:D-alanyl-D-alanine carboxypeptidase [Bacillota bacterium]
MLNRYLNPQKRCKFVHNGFIIFIQTLLIIFATQVGIGLICARAEAVSYTPTVHAKSAVLVDFGGGQVLYSLNPNMKLPPASITKIMTMLLTMEGIDAKQISLSDTVRTSAHAASIGGSQIWLKEGEELPLESMLKAIAIVSANDASTAVAEFVAGSEEDFVKMMNRRAHELGMKDTHFVNPDGLPAPDHYSTAYDIAIMARELLKHPKVLEWTSKWIENIPRPAVPEGVYPLKNTNALIQRYPGADGLKTGMTEEAGYCLVGTAKRNGARLISVVLGTDSDEARLTETIKLLNYGFRNFASVHIISKGQEAGKVRVPGGVKEMVTVVAADDLSVFVEKGKEQMIDKTVKSVERQAPVKKGEKIGVLEVNLEKKKLGEVDLLSTEDVGRANFVVRIIRAIRDFFKGLFGLGR